MVDSTTIAYAGSCTHHTQRDVTNQAGRVCPPTLPYSPWTLTADPALTRSLRRGTPRAGSSSVSLPGLDGNTMVGLRIPPTRLCCAATSALAEAGELACLLRCPLCMAIQTSTHRSSGTQRQRRARNDTHPITKVLPDTSSEGLLRLARHPSVAADTERMRSLLARESAPPSASGFQQGDRRQPEDGPSYRVSCRCSPAPFHTSGRVGHADLVTRRACHGRRL